MQRSRCLFPILLLTLTAPLVRAEDALEPANTYGVIVGVLKWEKSALSGFSDRNRKDQELHDLLVKRGVPKENLALLLDEKATLANIRTALATMSKQAKAGSTFVFYYAGHGSKLPNDNFAFCNYDHIPKDPAKPALNLKTIDETLQPAFKGARVILLADCCHSGGLKFVAERLTKAGIPAASVTSADACNVSTGNWTFSQAVIDSLSGLALIDDNNDGSIQLGEMAREVSTAMMYREMQKCGVSLTGVKAEFKLGATAKQAAPGIAKMGFKNGDYVWAPDKGQQRPARVLGFGDGKYDVEFYDYSDKRVVRTAPADLKAIAYRRHKVGDEITVLWGGQPYKAKVLRLDGDFHFITYPGYESSWDEWVLSNRIVDGKAPALAPVRARAEVEWKGDWYPAEVLKTEGKKYFIRYIGYDDSWNEWVEKDRIRFPKK